MPHRPVTRLLYRSTPRLSTIPRRNFISGNRRTGGRVTETLNVQELARRRIDYERNRRTFLGAGAVAGIVSCIYTAWLLKEAIQNPKKLDSLLPPTDPLIVGDDVSRKVVIHDDEGREIVPTGNSTVPDFPRTINLPSTSPLSVVSSESRLGSTLPQTETTNPNASTTEYTLVGLGLRTVSFLGIQVYVVGYYIATADVAALQARLVKKINPLATTLIPGEKDLLRHALLDPVEGEETWKALLEEGIPARSVFRIVPVRDTDFHHLRDGFVRAIQPRSGSLSHVTRESASTTGDRNTVQDVDFGESMRDFRQLFNRGKVPKRKELLLARDADGRLTVLFDDGQSAGQRKLLGVVEDERISRALWLTYLAGKTVASEVARKNIVEGIIEFVERPIGTVAAQVV